MAVVEDKASPSPNPKPPSKRRLSGWSNLPVKKNGNQLKHVMFTMQLRSLSSEDPKLSLLGEILLKILSMLRHSQQDHNFLFCKRWLNLQGHLVQSLKVLDWDFLQSSQLITRFPNLTHFDLLNACLIS